MMRRYMSLFVVLFAMLATVGWANAAEEPKRETVFMNLAWGDSVDKLGEVIAVPHVPPSTDESLRLAERMLAQKLGGDPGGPINMPDSAAISMANDFYGEGRDGPSWRQMTEKDFHGISYRIYRSKNEPKALGSLTVDRILYGFANGELIEIKVIVTKDAAQRLMGVLETKYGRASYGLGLRFQWDLGDTLVFMSAIQDNSFTLRNETRWSYYKKLMAEQNKQREEAYKKQLEQDANAW